ncbi:MAG: tetratricopeptide repeat protein, partial [Phycisphaerae bacterium]
LMFSSRCLRRLAVGAWGVHALLLLAMTLPSLIAYAWYAQIAWGDRFVASLLLPWLLLGCLVLERCSSWRTSDHIRRTAAWLPSILAILVTLEGLGFSRAQALEADQAFIQFYANETRALERTGAYELAERGYAGIVQLDPTFGEAWKSLGMLALAAGEIENAVPRLAKAVDILPQDHEVRSGYGSALLQAGQSEDAVRALAVAVELSPSFAPAWFNLGAAYLQLKDWQRYEEVVDKLRKLSPPLALRLEYLKGGGN